MRATLQSLALAVLWSAAGLFAGCSGGPDGGSCVTNQDCPEAEICISGSCVGAAPLGCRNDNACGAGEYCDLSDGVCKMREVVTCGSDGDCPRDQRCNTLTGVCIDGRRSCRDDASCAAIQMVCEPTLQQCVDCYEPGHCTAPATCVNNECRDPSGGCVLDVDCSPPDTICSGGACVLGCNDPNTPNPCGLGTVCNTNTGRCESGASTCQNDAECRPPSTICISNQCIPGCGEVGGLQCTGGDVCDPNTGRCTGTNACVGDSDCTPPATVCESGSCVAGCSQPGGLSCASGTVCDTGTGRCVTVSGPCSTDIDCGPPSRVCEGGQCVGGCGEVGGIQCVGNTVCNRSTGRCDAGGAVCTGDQDCSPPATVCNLSTGACDPGCLTTGCPAGQTCNQSTGRCGGGQSNLPLSAACVANTDCQSGHCFDFGQTVGSVCVESCGSHADCPSAFTCYEHFGAKLCVSAQLFSGATFSTPTGGACTMGGECQSNYCPNNTCTSLCSENSDCGGVACSWSEFTADRYIASCSGPRGAGANGSICAADADCRSGVCYGTGVCGDLCGSTVDCPNGTICAPVNYSVCLVDVSFSCLLWQPNFVKACVQSPHGSAPTGTPCADMNGSNCRDGFCNGTTNQCTGTCSRDSDCPNGMTCGTEVFGNLDGDDVYVNICE